jgi:hypothetical protein
MDRGDPSKRPRYDGMPGQDYQAYDPESTMGYNGGYGERGPGLWRVRAH